MEPLQADRLLCVAGSIVKRDEVTVFDPAIGDFKHELVVKLNRDSKWLRAAMRY